MAYSKKNKGRNKVTFGPGDCVWVHLRKKTNLQKGKLDSRGDELFQVIEKIKGNAYKIDLPSEHNVNATFNVSN